MGTGASTADLAVILLDVTKGVLTQSRRHAFIASLLEIPHMLREVTTFRFPVQYAIRPHQRFRG